MLLAGLILITLASNLMVAPIHPFLTILASFLAVDAANATGLQNLIRTIANLTTDVALLAIALAALSYKIGTILRGSLIPLRQLREYGNGLMMDSIKSIFLVAAYSAIASLIVWIAALLSSP